MNKISEMINTVIARAVTGEQHLVMCKTQQFASHVAERFGRDINQYTVDADVRRFDIKFASGGRITFGWLDGSVQQIENVVRGRRYDTLDLVDVYLPEIKAENADYILTAVRHWFINKIPNFWDLREKDAESK